MSRISLREAYDNKDVIAWLVRHQDAIEELQNILKDITPGGDLTNVVTKTGNQVIDGEKTFIGKIIADCDIIQNGSAYETHAEQVFSHNDLMIMRDGAVNGLSAGEYSGLQVEKYDGANTGRMVMDNTGIMRVGKLNDEQPLATRDEASSMKEGYALTWDSTNKRAVTSSIQPKTKITISAAQTLTNAGAQTVNFDTTSDSTNFPLTNGKVKIKKAGLYLFHFSVRLNTSATPTTPIYTRFRAYLNNQTFVGVDYRQTTNIETKSGTIFIQLQENDEIYLDTYWTDSTPTGTIDNYTANTYMQLMRLPFN